MSDKPYNEDEKKDEYQTYDEHTDVNYEYKENKSDTKVKRKSKYKGLITVVIALIVVWFIFKIVGIVRESEHSSALPPQAKVTKQHLPAISDTALDKKPVVSKPVISKPVVVAPITLNKQASSSQKALSREVAENASAIAGIERSQQETAQHLTDVATALQSVSQQVAQFSNELQSFGEYVNAQKAAQAKAATAKATAEKAAATQYRHQTQFFVEAVIPGRAWLKGMNGHAETVAVGDTIKGYGKVVSIDPYSGDVTTSSGGVIKYAVNEG